MIRPDRDTYFFDVAQKVSTRATCPRAAIGCVIVHPQSHRILSTGYNGASANEAHCTDVGCILLADHCIRATHAEVNAARGVRTGDRDLVAYVVGPRPICSHCARSLYAAGVRDVRWQEAVPSLEAVLAEVVAWGRETFPASTDATKTLHLIEEARELHERPDDPLEIADVLMILAHLAASKGVILADAVSEKLSICRQRTWARPDENGVIRHVRTAASPAPDTVLGRMDGSEM